MAITLTPALQREYERLFETCRVRPRHAQQVDQAVARIARHRDRYEAVSRRQGVPWVFVGLVHDMESGGDFTRHLHNGDPLTARTRWVPAGRRPLPAGGSPGRLRRLRAAARRAAPRPAPVPRRA